MFLFVLGRGGLFFFSFSVWEKLQLVARNYFGVHEFNFNKTTFWGFIRELVQTYIFFGIYAVCTTPICAQVITYEMSKKFISITCKNTFPTTKTNAIDRKS